MSACPTRRNLYVADWGAGGDEGGQVLEINLSNRDIEVRSRICIQGVDKPRKLSLNKDDLLIVCGNRLVFYRLDEFVEIKHIDLPENSEPQHAVVTASGTFLVGHGQQLDLPHRVTELSADGKTQIRSYGGNTSGRLVGQLSWPAHLCLGTEDGGGRVILADCDNDRLLMLTAELQLERLLINKDDDDIDKPRRLCYVKRSGTLLVGLDFGFVDVYLIRRRRFDR